MSGRIIYVTGNWMQPSETFIRHEVRRLQSHGVALSIASIHHCHGLGDDGICLSAQPAPTPSNRPARQSRPSRLKTSLSSIRHRTRVNRLVEWAKAQGATHLHAAFGGLPALLCAKASSRLGIPYSVSLHANDVLVPVHLDATLFSDADKLFCCNRNAMDRLLARSPQLGPKLVLSRHGIDLRDWRFSPKPTLAPPIRFLFVGRLVPKKDPERAAGLVASLVEAKLDAGLTMIGDGPVVPKAVEPLGFLPQAQVQEWMSKSDFLICTSRELEDGDAEGVPNVILEAMASGLPVISTVSGSIGEVVSGQTAFTIDSDAAFPELVRTAVMNDTERLARIQAARSLVEREWDAEDLIAIRAAYFKPFL